MLLLGLLVLLLILPHRGEVERAPVGAVDALQIRAGGKVAHVFKGEGCIEAGRRSNGDRARRVLCHKART